MNKKGFTLVELLVVIAIVGVLAGVVMVAINPATRMAEARDAGKKNDVGQVATAMEAYYTRQTPVLYPANVAALQTSGDLKRDLSSSVTIVGGGTGTAAAYALLEATASHGCTTGSAYWCYETTTGTSGIVCKATAPDTSCN